MGFEELVGRRVRRQHFLDPLAQVRVLATHIGEVRGPLVGRQFAGSIEDFFFPISVGAHFIESASTRDYAFSHSKRSHREKSRKPRMRAFWSRGIPPVGGKGCANLRESRN